MKLLRGRPTASREVLEICSGQAGDDVELVRADARCRTGMGIGIVESTAIGAAFAAGSSGALQTGSGFVKNAGGQHGPQRAVFPCPAHGFEANP